MYVIPFVLFLFVQGRSYYLAPAYPILIAGGVIVVEQWTKRLATRKARLVWGMLWAVLAVGGLLFVPVMLPIAPINSSFWNLSSQLHDNFVEQIGWPELVTTVADIYHKLPEEEQQGTGILTGNYGEAGAVNMYGPAYGLPEAISGINSYCAGMATRPLRP